MESLVADMVKTDPAKRPTMDEVVVRFAKIRNKHSTRSYDHGWLAGMNSGRSLPGGQLGIDIVPSVTSLVARQLFPNPNEWWRIWSRGQNASSTGA
jgi:hypothetical protein